MYKRKQTILMIEMSIFFCFVFVSFGLIVLHEKGNILIYPTIEKKLKQYFDDHYSSIEQQVTGSELLFSFKEKQYYFIYQHQKNPDLNFKIIYHKDKKITSTYQEDYVEGKSFLSKNLSLVTKEAKTTLKEENVTHLSLEPVVPLKDLSTQEQEKILKGDSKEVSFFEVRYTTSLLRLSTSEMCKNLERIHALLKQENIHPFSYQVTFTLEENGSKGLILRNVQSNFIENGKLETIINTLYQTNQKIDETTKIEMEEL